MVTDANFESQVLKSPLPVLLYCWATWCSTCSAINPIIDEFARDAKGRVRVGRLNVEANQVLATKFNVTSIPFIFIFDNGQLKENFPGALTKHEIMMKLTRYL
jgi:thioredoxin